MHPWCIDFLSRLVYIRLSTKINVNISELLKLWRVEKGASELAQMPPQFYSEARQLTNGGNPYEAKKAKNLYTDLVNMRQHKLLMACLREFSGSDKPENLLSIEKSAYLKIYNELSAMRAGAVQVVDEVELVEEEETKDPEEEEQETIPEAEEKQEAEEEMSAPEEDIEIPKKEEATCELSEEGQLECDVDEVSEELDGEFEEAEEEPEEASKEAETPKEETKKPKGDVFIAETENKALKRVKFLRSMPAFVGPDLTSLGPFNEDQVVMLDDEIAEILLKNDAVELIGE